MSGDVENLLQTRTGGPGRLRRRARRPRRQSKPESFPGGRFDTRDEDDRARHGSYALTRRTTEAAAPRAWATAALAGAWVGRPLSTTARCSPTPPSGHDHARPSPTCSQDTGPGRADHLASRPSVRPLSLTAPAMRCCLVVANQTLTTDTPTRAVEDRIAAGPHEFHVVARPPRHEGGGRRPAAHATLSPLGDRPDRLIGRAGHFSRSGSAPAGPPRPRRPRGTPAGAPR